jgi:hypothetical protein
VVGQAAVAGPPQQLLKQLFRHFNNDDACTPSTGTYFRSTDRPRDLIRKPHHGALVTLTVDSMASHAITSPDIHARLVCCNGPVSECSHTMLECRGLPRRVYAFRHGLSRAEPVGRFPSSWPIARFRGSENPCGRIMAAQCHCGCRARTACGSCRDRSTLFVALKSEWVIVITAVLFRRI